MKLLKPSVLWLASNFLLLGCTAKNGTLKSDPPILVTPAHDPAADTSSRSRMGSPNREYDQDKIDSIRKHGVKKKKQIPPGDAD
jgi:uncharacterized lipoprotein YajG